MREETGESKYDLRSPLIGAVAGMIIGVLNSAVAGFAGVEFFSHVAGLKPKARHYAIGVLTATATYLGCLGLGGFMRGVIKERHDYNRVLYVVDGQEELVPLPSGLEKITKE